MLFMLGLLLLARKTFVFSEISILWNVTPTRDFEHESFSEDP